MNECFRRCPICGGCLKSSFQYMYGNACILWICPCGYFEDGEEIVIDNKNRNGEIQHESLDYKICVERRDY